MYNLSNTLPPRMTELIVYQYILKFNTKTRGAIKSISSYTSNHSGKKLRHDEQQRKKDRVCIMRETTHTS